MSEIENEFGQPIGAPVPEWRPVERPSRTSMEGRYCRIEALDPERHAADLFEAYSPEPAARLWTYMPQEWFGTEAKLRDWMATAAESEDPLFYTLIERESGRAVGIAAYMRIVPEHGVIEVGNIAFAPRLQRTPIATEAMFLMMKRVFNELGYRRYEWKCDSHNAPSRRAAERFGFQYEGLFRQAIVYKGRNRDTAWFAMTDEDWPAIEAVFEKWLDPSNFDADGQQISKLSDLMMAARPSS